MHNMSLADINGELRLWDLNEKVTLYGGPVLMLVGTVGNLTAAYVAVKSKELWKYTFSLYILVLAIWDTLTLDIFIVNSILLKKRLVSNSLYIQTVNNIVVYMCPLFIESNVVGIFGSKPQTKHTTLAESILVKTRGDKMNKVSF